MGNFFAGLFGGLGQAAQYKYAGATALARGGSRRNSLESQAGALEQDARVNQAIATYNMSQVREVQRKAVASAFNASANNGFMSSGTGGAVVKAVRDEYDTRVGNMAMGSAMEARNAMNQAENLRQGGRNAMLAAQAESEMYRSLAKSTRQGAILNAVGGLFTAAGGAIDSWQKAGQYNDFVSSWNKLHPEAKLGSVSRTRAAFSGGFAGLNGQTNFFDFL